jgi:hypothetical protein
VHARTPLEAMWALTNTVSINAVIVSSAVGDQSGELFEHLEEHHPAARRILLFGEQLEPVQRSTSSRVHAVLRTPWRIRALARALAIDARDSSMALLPRS